MRLLTLIPIFSIVLACSAGGGGTFVTDAGEARPPPPVSATSSRDAAADAPTKKSPSSGAQCGDEGVSCIRGRDCCSDVCDGNLCEPCAREGETCGTRTRCCVHGVSQALSCRSGVCESGAPKPPTCLRAGEACSTTCCFEATCLSGTCVCNALDTFRSGRTTHSPRVVACLPPCCVEANGCSTESGCRAIFSCERSCNGDALCISQCQQQASIAGQAAYENLMQCVQKNGC